MGKGEKSDPPLLKVRHLWDYCFGVTNGEMEKNLWLAASTGPSDPVFPAE